MTIIYYIHTYLHNIMSLIIISLWSILSLYDILGFYIATGHLNATMYQYWNLSLFFSKHFVEPPGTIYIYHIYVLNKFCDGIMKISYLANNTKLPMCDANFCNKFLSIIMRVLHIGVMSYLSCYSSLNGDTKKS